MKKYFLLLLALLLFTTSCKKCGDCFRGCYGLSVKINILNDGSDGLGFTGFNAIGDNFDKPYIKYIADSILYQIVTPHDTIGSLSPELIGSGEYILKLRYNFPDKYIKDKTGWYYFILHLNDVERDTIRVYHKGGDSSFYTYLSDSLAAHTDCDGTPVYPEMAIADLCLTNVSNCEGNPYSIKFFK